MYDYAVTIQPDFPRYMRKPHNEEGADFIQGLIDLYTEADVRGGKAVEVGSWTGESAEIAAQMVGELVCIDPWLGPEGQYHESVFEERMAAYGNVRKMRLASHEAARHFQDESLDLVYIDGMHDYANVLRDICCWLPKVKHGGWIAGHDYDDAESHRGVVQAVDAVLGSPERRYCDSSWLFRKTDELVNRALNFLSTTCKPPERPRGARLKKFVVTGCGRSGTQYVTRVLRAHGLRVSHEGIFLPSNEVALRELDLTAWFDDEWLHGDVSWCAVGFLDVIPDDWELVHIVRNPVKAIRSYLAVDYFRPGTGRAALWAEYLLGADAVGKAMRYWAGWNRRLWDWRQTRRPDMALWALEDISQDAMYFVELYRRIGITNSRLQYVEPDWRCVRQDVGAAIYAGKTTDETVTWDWLPEGPDKDAVREMAMLVGYSERDLKEA